MIDAALVLAVVGLCGGVVLAARAQAGAAERLLTEARLDIAERVAAQETEQAAWRRERAQLLNRIQAPDAAVGEAFAEQDALEREARAGKPRDRRYRNEDDEVRSDLERQTLAQLQGRGLDPGELAAAAQAHRDGVAFGPVG